MVLHYWWNQNRETIKFKQEAEAQVPTCVNKNTLAEGLNRIGDRWPVYDLDDKLNEGDVLDMIEEDENTGS